MSLDFLEILPTPEAACVEEVFEPGKPVLLKRFGRANAIDHGSAAQAGVHRERLIPADGVPHSPNQLASVLQPLVVGTPAVLNAPGLSPMKVVVTSILKKVKPSFIRSPMRSPYFLGSEVPVVSQYMRTRSRFLSPSKRQTGTPNTLPAISCRAISIAL